MKIVIGCPVAERAWVLPSWFDAIYAQDVEAEIEIVALYSKSEDETEKILIDNGAQVFYDVEPARQVHEIDGHVWPANAYDYMARMRNQLLDIVIDTDADYFFSLDSDILLPANGLAKLLQTAATAPGVLAPAVNMTIRAVAWNTMEWKDTERAERMINHDLRAGLIQVDVVMAAMFLDRHAVESLRWLPHEQGEDIGFCLDAERKQINRWWVPSVNCAHVMIRQGL